MAAGGELEGTCGIVGAQTGRSQGERSGVAESAHVCFEKSMSFSPIEGNARLS